MAKIAILYASNDLFEIFHQVVDGSPGSFHTLWMAKHDNIRSGFNQHYRSESLPVDSTITPVTPLFRNTLSDL
jgi:hypothetical protein